MGFTIEGFVIFCYVLKHFQTSVKWDSTSQSTSQMAPYSLQSALLFTKFLRVLDKSSALHWE